jgi:hypothetical protein
MKRQGTSIEFIPLEPYLDFLEEQAKRPQRPRPGGVMVVRARKKKED